MFPISFAVVKNIIPKLTLFYVVERPDNNVIVIGKPTR